MTEIQAQPSLYTRLYSANIKAGHSSTDAAALVANFYLDGKPRRQGKRKTTSAERDAALWSSEFLRTLPAEAWHAEPLVLALARYMGQERASNPDLLAYIVSVAPESVQRAIRYSGLVLKPRSRRRAEIDRLEATASDEFRDFVRVLRVFETAYSERSVAVDMLRQPLAELSPLDLLAYVSLYAFEHLVPRPLRSTHQPTDVDAHTQAAWHSINAILIWKLSTADGGAFRLTEGDIAKSLGTHLSPFLFPPSNGAEPRNGLYGAFRELLAAQIELDSFVLRSADAFSYDDSIAFVLQGDRLEIAEHDPAARAAWNRIGERLTRLHDYWFHRAAVAFSESCLATTRIGRIENHERNRLAYVNAMRTHLRLTEVYGLSESVTAESGLHVDLFEALLSLELMSVFFQSDFLLPYLQYLRETGNARMALGRLAWDGLTRPDMQNRFPITWSDRSSKISNIAGWMVNTDSPGGSRKRSEAVLDFWTSDWASAALRLRKGHLGLNPELFERPILKMGRYLFQLPWMVGIQNNSSAAINNLRRIGSRRFETRDETRRIEERLAGLFRNRNFRVQLRYEPDRTIEDDPGEVDLICVRDGGILVLEVKSTYLRSSQKDTWLHGSITLRKAGLQLHRKVRAVTRAVATDTVLASRLDIKGNTDSLAVRGWIVDTSIEHDHEKFSGFLKVSLEELIIALRDDRHLLNGPEGLRGGVGEEPLYGRPTDRDLPLTMYPDGFSFSSFVEVIESESVWK